MNNCVFSGFIGKKGIELKPTSSGKMVATYSLAIPRRTKGEYDYINCVTWNAPAEFLKNNEDRIKSLMVRGRVNTRNYDNSEGKKVYVTEFITDDVEVKEWVNDGQAQADTSNNGFVELDNMEDCPF